MINLRGSSEPRISHEVAMSIKGVVLRNRQAAATAADDKRIKGVVVRYRQEAAEAEGENRIRDIDVLYGDETQREGIFD